MRVRSITEVPPRRVWAVRTSTGTFIADGLAHHNCYHCNVGLKGNWIEFYKHMVKDFGEERVKEMIYKEKEVKQYKIYQIEEIRTEIKNRLKELA
jgi:hypothetical protein